MASPSPLIRYQYKDHLGSATLETNEAAEIISYEEYHPYGTTAYSTYVNGNYSTKRYRFTGKERDDETGLYYFGVRYYAAWLGRWTSSDPGDFVDGLNMYVYVRNNPVNGVDELGYSTDTLEPSTENTDGKGGNGLWIPYDKDGNKIDISQEGWEENVDGYRWQRDIHYLKTIKILGINDDFSLEIENLLGNDGTSIDHDKTIIARNGVSDAEITRETKEGKYHRSVTTNYRTVDGQPVEENTINFDRQILFSKEEVLELWDHYRNNNCIGDCIGFLYNGIKELTGVEPKEPWNDNYRNRTAYQIVDQVEANNGGEYLKGNRGDKNTDYPYGENQKNWIPNTDIEEVLDNSRGDVGDLYAIYAGQYLNGHSLLFAINDKHMLKMDQYPYQSKHSKPEFWSRHEFFSNYLQANNSIFIDSGIYTTYLIRLYNKK